jgi:parallel beta-helix repeat protein
MKRIKTLIMFFLLLSLSASAYSFRVAKAQPVLWSVAETGTADFHSIQAAINAASPGDTIVVKSGTYLEVLTINKSVTIVGGNPLNTFIDGITSSGAITISANNVNLLNFSISNLPQIASPAITINQFSDITIANNTISNSQTGLALYGTSNSYVANNTITSNSYAISADSSTRDNIFYQNNITQNTVGIYLFFSYQNTFYSNNFVGNILQVLLIGQASNNWDNGYPAGGNYWGDYGGVDQNFGQYQNVTGKDGIGDTSYTIGVNNVDWYPLMRPYSFLPGDLNRDGTVNFEDLIYFASGYIGYWETFTIPSQYKVCDINIDGEINIIDLVFFAQDYIAYQQSVGTH